MFMGKSWRPAWLFLSYSWPRLCLNAQIFISIFKIQKLAIDCSVGGSVWIFLAHSKAIQFAHSSLLLSLNNFIELYLEILFLGFLLQRYPIWCPLNLLCLASRATIFSSISFEFSPLSPFWLLFYSHIVLYPAYLHVCFF